jgi:hypothetical protein
MLFSNTSNPPKSAKPVFGATSYGKPNLSFFNNSKLPNTPFKRFKLSETFQTGSWSCQLWQAKSFLFY